MQSDFTEIIVIDTNHTTVMKQCDMQSDYVAIPLIGQQVESLTQV